MEVVLIEEELLNFLKKLTYYLTKNGINFIEPIPVLIAMIQN